MHIVGKVGGVEGKEVLGRRNIKRGEEGKTNYYPFCRGIHAWTVYTLLALLLALMAHRYWLSQLLRNLIDHTNS